MSGLVVQARTLGQQHMVGEEVEELCRRWHKLVSGLQARLSEEEEQRVEKTVRSLQAWVKNALQIVDKKLDTTSQSDLADWLEELQSIQVGSALQTAGHDWIHYNYVCRRSLISTGKLWTIFI